MPGTVHAMVLVKPKTLVAREFARPAIGPDAGLLRLEACGICGSDYEQYEGAQPPHEDYTPYPVIPGHEPLGIIEEIGARVDLLLGIGLDYLSFARRSSPPSAISTIFSANGCNVPARKREAMSRGEIRACEIATAFEGSASAGSAPLPTSASASTSSMR